MAYQWYNLQRMAAKEELSADYVADLGEQSVFPVGSTPSQFARPDDHSSSLSNDTFTMLEGGNTDISALVASSAAYRSKFSAQQPMTVSQTSQSLGPAESIMATGQGASNLSFVQTTVPMTDQSPLGHDDISEALSDGVLPEGYKEHVDHRNDSGRREKGTALTGALTCGWNTIKELAELVKEIGLFIKDAALAAAWYAFGDGLGSKDNVNAVVDDVRAVWKQVEEAMGLGLLVLAALDVYFPSFLKTNPTIAALTKALKTVYTDVEWRALAERGRQKATLLVEEAKKIFLEDPDYAVGYIVCEIVLMLSPAQAIKILKDFRKLEKVGDIIGDAEKPPEGKGPSGLSDDKPAQGDPSPQGRDPKGWVDPEGRVEPKYVEPGTKGAIEVDNPDGMPKYVMPGKVTVRPEDLTRLNDIQKADFEGDLEIAQLLSRRGYDVEMIDDPVLKMDLGTGADNPFLREGDFPYDVPHKKKGFVGRQKWPDYRVNGVVFDLYSPTSGKDLREALDQLEKKISDRQARNFVVHVRPGETVQQYYDMVKANKNRDVFKKTTQIIFVDQRTGEVRSWMP